jgi:hypothetical protein
MSGWQENLFFPLTTYQGWLYINPKIDLKMGFSNGRTTLVLQTLFVI